MSQEFESDFEISSSPVPENGEEVDTAVSADVQSAFAPIEEDENESEAIVDADETDTDSSDEIEPTSIATSFGTVTDRLSEIAEVMEDDTLSLDDALDLLEEAVALGMQASNLLESDMNERDAAEEEAEAALDAEDGVIEGDLTATGDVQAMETQAANAQDDNAQMMDTSQV